MIWIVPLCALLVASWIVIFEMDVNRRAKNREIADLQKKVRDLKGLLDDNWMLLMQANELLKRSKRQHP